MTYKITHERDGCIGCGACAAIDEENWEMDDEGKSKLKGTNSEEKTFKSDELEKHKETAEACPVNVIHIYKDDEQII